MSTSNQQVADRGRDLVARELERRGARGVREVTTGRRKELRAVTPDGRQIAVRVKTKRSGTWQPSVREADPTRTEPGVDRFWVFVDLADVRPDYYVLRESVIQADIRKTYEQAIARHGGERKHSPGSEHHAVPVARVERWRDRLDELGLT